MYQVELRLTSGADAHRLDALLLGLLIVKAQERLMRLYALPVLRLLIYSER